MTTTVVSTIGSTGTYSTMQLWEDAAPANLVTADEIWEGQLQNQTFTITSGAVCTFGGSTTSSTQFKRLRCVAGASFRDNANAQTNALRYNTANGAAITTSTSYGSGLALSEANVHVLGLQIEGTINSSGVLSVSTTPYDCNDCIFEYLKNGGVSLATGTFQNSLVVGRRATAMNPIIALAGGTVTFTNNTVAVPSNLTKATVAFSNSTTVFNATSCAFFGATALTSGSTSNTYLNCATDIASPPAGNIIVTYNTSAFANITDATRDYRLVSGSGLVDTGATNASPDIVGTTRPQGGAYDIGCWELVVASGTWKTSNGLAVASIKTVNGLAKASIKTNQGLTP